jgi:hypothetical protein
MVTSHNITLFITSFFFKKVNSQKTVMYQSVSLGTVTSRSNCSQTLDDKKTAIETMENPSGLPQFQQRVLLFAYLFKYTQRDRALCILSF